MDLSIGKIDWESVGAIQERTDTDKSRLFCGARIEKMERCVKENAIAT